MNAKVETVASLKRIVVAVYICQILSFLLAGLPLLVGVWLNFLNKKDAQGTWLESHFEWQIKTAWQAIAGFALAGLTFDEFVIGFPILIATLTLMVFRIVVGWNAVNADEAVFD
jgi:uncharacterized membrane protein